MDTTRTIERERWQRYLANHAEQLRTGTAEVQGLTQGGTGRNIGSVLVESLVYDPEADSVRLVGQKEASYVIESPSAMFAREGAAGELTALEVVDSEGVNYLITFAQPKAIGR